MVQSIGSVNIVGISNVKSEPANKLPVSNADIIDLATLSGSKNIVRGALAKLEIGLGLESPTSELGISTAKHLSISTIERIDNTGKESKIDFSQKMEEYHQRFDQETKRLAVGKDPAQMQAFLQQRQYLESKGAAELASQLIKRLPSPTSQKLEELGVMRDGAPEIVVTVR